MELTMTSSAFAGRKYHEQISVEEYLFKSWESEDGYPEDDTINNVQMFASKIDVTEKLEYVQFCLDCYGSSLLIAFSERKFKEELRNGNPHCVVFFSDENSENLKPRKYNFPITFDNRHKINEDYVKYLLQYFIEDKKNIDKLSWKGLDDVSINSYEEAVSSGLVFGCLGDVEDSFYSGNVKNRIVLAKKIFRASQFFLNEVELTDQKILNVNYLAKVVSFLKRYNSKEDNAVFLKPFMEENISLLSSGKLNVSETVKRITMIGQISEISEMIEIVPDRDYINKFMTTIVDYAIEEKTDRIVINKPIWGSLESLVNEIGKSGNPMSLADKKNIDYFRLDLYKADLLGTLDVINEIYNKDINEHSYIQEVEDSLEIVISKSVSNKENILKTIYNTIVTSNLDNLKERSESFQELLAMKKDIENPSVGKKLNIKKF